MIKVLVAEDQVLIQKDICRKIEKTEKNVEIAGTAMNGQDAYEKILALHPDILITDIRMPIQTGLELIRRLKEEAISIKTVILSGYRDFEYAKEAIQLGVDEYLLKPVSVEDLRYVLDTLEEKIISEQNYSYQHALYRMLNSGTPIPGYLLNAISYNICQLMLINLNSCATFSFQDWLPYENELEDILKGPVVNKYLKKGETVRLCGGNTYNQKLLVFFLHKTPPEKIDMMALELQRQIMKLTDAVTICISKSVYSVNDLAAEYKLSKTQLTNQLIFAHSAILHSRDFLENSQDPAVTLQDQQLENFRFCIHTQNLDGLLEHLDHFLDHCDHKRTTQKQLGNCLKLLLLVCYDDTGGRQLSSRELEIDEYLSNSKTYAELKLSLHLLFEQLFRQRVLNLASSVKPESLVTEVKEYIRNNYGRDININDIAVHFSITPAYLSRLFKKHSDVRPIEYLTSYRISQACDYFAHSQLTVREVAELCGYSNQFYFSKAFKQITSMSPSEYRIQHQGEGL